MKYINLDDAVYQDKPLINLLKAVKNNEILLPNFQRGFVWNKDQQIKLLSSLFANIPIGSLLLLSTKDDTYASRKAMYRNNLSDTDLDVKFDYYLLDGQQRISTLLSMFSSFTKRNLVDEEAEEKKTARKNIYPQLLSHWYISLDDENNDIDLWGIKDLEFSKDKAKEYTPEDYESSFHYIDFSKNYHMKDILSPYNSKSTSKERIEEFAKRKILPLWIIMDQFNDDDTVFSDKNILYKILSRIVSHNLNEKHDHDPVKVLEATTDYGNTWVTNIRDFLARIMGCHIPIILSKDISKGVVIFENLNRGGQPLSVFDLVLARMSKEENKSNLKEVIVNGLKGDILIKDNTEYKEIFNKKENVLDNTKEWNALSFATNANTNQDISPIISAFLNILSLLISSKKSDFKIQQNITKKKYHLRLDSKDIQENCEEATELLKKSIAFLQFNCGLQYFKQMPYNLMILPIALCFIKNKKPDRRYLDLMERWYWKAIFSGEYQYAQNTVVMKHLTAINEDPEFKFIKNWKIFEKEEYSNSKCFIANKKDKLEYGAINSKIHLAILQYQLSTNPYDFVTGDAVVLNAWDNTIVLQDHHIYPLNNETKIKESTTSLRKNKSHVLNSSFNRIYISATANKDIGGKLYKQYMDDLISYTPEIKEKAFIDTYDDIPETPQKFVKARYKTIIGDMQRKLK